MRDDDLDLNFDDVANGTQNEVLLSKSLDQVSWDKDSLRKAQEKDFVVTDNAECEPTELAKPVIGWYNGILYRYSRAVRASAHDYEVRRQVVVPEIFRSKLLMLTHEDQLSGHFGVYKTLWRLSKHLWLPKIKKSVMQ